MGSQWLCRHKVGKAEVPIVYTPLELVNVSELKDKTIILSSEVQDEAIEIPVTKLLSNFEPSGSISTCHSLQGRRCKGNICLFDTDLVIAKDKDSSAKRWLYTSITRTTNLNNVYICHDNTPLTIFMQIKHKINDHITQDLKRGLDAPAEMAKVHDVWDQLVDMRFRCPYCARCIEHCYVLHRPDNSLPLQDGNCQPICPTCNSTIAGLYERER